MSFKEEMQALVDAALYIHRHQQVVDWVLTRKREYRVEKLRFATREQQQLMLLEFRRDFSPELLRPQSEVVAFITAQVLAAEVKFLRERWRLRMDEDAPKFISSVKP